MHIVHKVLIRIKTYVIITLLSALVLLYIAPNSEEWNLEEEKDNTIGLKYLNRLYYCVSMLATGGESGGMHPTTIKTKIISMILAFIALGGLISLLFEIKWESK